jgi:transposase-like protein
MNPKTVFCPHEDCVARGHIGKGNITIHSKKEKRYRCKECGRTFSERKGSALYRLHRPAEMMVTVLKLLSHGCPIPAIVAAYELDERTIADWQQKSGQHAKAVHETLVEQPREHKQVQSDELRLKIFSAVLWIAMSIAPVSRLWLGAEVSHTRGRDFITSMMKRTARCCKGTVLLVTDGLVTYIKAVKKAFSISEGGKGKTGRPRLISPQTIFLAQVVKSYSSKGKRYVCHGVHKCLCCFGSFVQIGMALKNSTGGLLNTACIERFNATLRQSIAGFARKSRYLFHKQEMVESAVYWVGTCYNFCTVHRSLSSQLPTTPAMAAGITDHLWSVKELLEYKVRPQPWVFKGRGRRSKKTLERIKKWATF